MDIGHSLYISTPTQADVDELLGFLTVFSVSRYQPVREWHGGPTGPKESLMPWPEYDEGVEAFIRVASKECWSDRRYDSEKVSRMLNDKAGINQASLTDIKSMLTFCVRGERFCDGHVGAMISNGDVQRILGRLAEITRKPVDPLRTPPV